MNIRRFLTLKLIIGILLTLCFGIALFFRIYLPYDEIFSNVGIKFSSIDAYYHMRLVDNLVHNFPHLNTFDPYFIYPGGSTVGSIHFFDWLLAGIIWVFSLGSPTRHIIDVIGVYYPAILGALIVFPVYFIGKALFNRWAGILAAALIVVFPGEFMGRSILGFTDYHVAEALFSAIAMLFLILAVKTATQRNLTLNHIWNRDWTVCTRPLLLALLSGVSLGIYLLTWGGGLLFIFIIAVYLIIQAVIDHLRHKSNDYLGIICFVLFLTARIMVMPFTPSDFYVTSLTVAVLTPLGLTGFSRLMTRQKIKPFYYPLALVGLGVAGLSLFYLINPVFFGLLLGKFGALVPAGASRTTIEMQPILSPQGSFTTALAWSNFTTSFFLFPSWPIPGFGFISFLILIFFSIKHGRSERNLFLIWSLIILIITLLQRRFAYYFVVNIALLTSYLSWQAIWFSGLRKLVAKPAEEMENSELETGKLEPENKKKVSSGFTIYHVNTILAILVVLVFAYYFNIPRAKAVAEQARFAPSDAWQISMDWLKDNSPDPFGDSDVYYQTYERPTGGESYDYPESAYGVTAWWDFGYWITRIAHRLPTSNPGQTPEPIINTTRLFLSQDESSAREAVEDLGSSYVIIDYDTTTSKFWAIVTWAEKDLSDYFDTYYIPDGNNLLPVQLYYPDYYRTIAARLFNFNGKAVAAQNPIVVSYTEEVSREGVPYKELANAQDFTTLEEALEYIEKQGSGNYKLVGGSPFISPVPVEAVSIYELVYSSEIGRATQGIGMVPEVKIFKYIE